MKDNPRFSLFEVLITVAALIITTIVLSNWLQSRRSAQESAAAQLRANNTRSFSNIPFNQALMSSRFQVPLPATISAQTHLVLTTLRTLPNLSLVVVGFSLTDHYHLNLLWFSAMMRVPIRGEDLLGTPL